jgi:osmotically-inducible protein OsmY
MKKLFSLAVLVVTARWLRDADRRDMVLARARGLVGRMPAGGMDAMRGATDRARDAAQRVPDTVAGAARRVPDAVSGAADRVAGAADGALGRDTDAADPARYAGNPDDARLTDKVESELFRDDDVPKGAINVNVEFGKVVLRGEVESRELIDEIVTRTRSIEGVNDVESLLHVPGEPAPMHE